MGFILGRRWIAMNKPLVLAIPHPLPRPMPLRLPDEDAPFIEPPLTALPPPPAAHPVREISPRDLASLAFELYLEGRLSLDDYLLIGFPSELHPAYDRTIGALTGRPARPDHARDMIREWENRVHDLRASSAPMAALTARAERTLALLRWLERPELGKP
jgi:hypothetical protein